LNANREKKYNFAPKLDAATLAGARVDSPQTFSFQNGAAFSKFLPYFGFQDSENETPNKGIIEMTDEELEKSIDALFFSRFTRYMTTTLD